MDSKNIFAIRLKKLRTDRGLTQKDLAQKIDMTNKNISTYESGYRQPEYDTLVKLARALNCSTDYLLGAVDDPNRFIGDVDGHHHEIVISQDAEDRPFTKKQFETLIRKLESIGIDPKTLMND